MKTNKKRLLLSIIILGVILVMVVFGFGVLAEDREINEEKSVAAKDINEIQVKLSSTAVDVIPSASGGDIVFHLYGHSKRDIRLIVDITNNTVTVTEKRGFDAITINEELKLDVYIPKDYDKSLFIKTTSGLVTMEDAALTSLTLETSSGGLTAEKLAADKILINTSSGKISIRNVNAGELKVKGTSAAVMIACGTFENQSVRIDTTSGRVTLTLPRTAEFSYDIGMTSGKLLSDFPINTDSKKTEGQVGTQTNEISIHSSSGSIELKKNEA